MTIVIMSDIHSNLAALEAVLSSLPPVDDVWCVGDVVGYGPCPNECVELIRGWHPSVWVAGNHDWATVGRLDTSGFNSDAIAATAWTASTLSEDDRHYLEGLPERMQKGEWTVVHGSPRHSVREYVLDCGEARPNFAYFSTKYAFVGHTHVPAIFRLEYSGPDGEECVGQSVVLNAPLVLGPYRAIINPGSVGQPRDGDPRACYVLLDEKRGTIEYRRVAYDVERTQNQMKKAGLPSRLWERLSFGL